MDSVINLLEEHELLPGAPLRGPTSEWSLMEMAQDCEGSPVKCQFCGRRSPKVYFEIRNNSTRRRLRVDIYCVLALGLQVEGLDSRLSPRQSVKQLLAQLGRQRHEGCVELLERLAQRETNAPLAGAMAFFRKHKYLLPRGAVLVLAKLRQQSISHDPAFFRINLRICRAREEFPDLTRAEVRLLWPTLSPAQRRYARQLRLPKAAELPSPGRLRASGERHAAAPLP